jgi:hypothetical protein
MKLDVDEALEILGHDAGPHRESSKLVMEPPSQQCSAVRSLSRFKILSGNLLGRERFLSREGFRAHVIIIDFA